MMQVDQPPRRHTSEDTFAIAGRQLLALVVSALGGVVVGSAYGDMFWAGDVGFRIPYDSMLAFVIGGVGLAMSVATVGYFQFLRSDASNHRAIGVGLMQILVTGVLASVLGIAMIGWMPGDLLQVRGIVIWCGYGVIASAAVQGVVTAVGLLCLHFGIGLPDFIDD